MKLIIVSNRLPLTISKQKDQFKLTQSIGGLATGLSTYLNHLLEIQKKDYVWLGWPGTALSLAEEKELREKLLIKKNLPIYLSEEIMHHFYDGFCNGTLWPIFLSMKNFLNYKEKEWLMYQKVNQIYCEEVAKIYEPNDIIWIHDYHLMLLPLLLRKQFPTMKIGFFLHIPFPPYEAIEYLPKEVRINLIAGLLGANLIGFHLNQYTFNFKNTVQKILGITWELGCFKNNHHLTRINSYPMGIDFQYFEKKAIKKNVAKLKKEFSLNENMKIILSIDRLDYTKGIINRIKIFESFLKNNSGWHKKIVFILLVAPSRTNIKIYRKTLKKINEYVGKVNGIFSKNGWVPILYQYHTFSIDELTSFYVISDICLVTPIRDGMNLIAKEYIASKVDKNGCLIVSDTSGSAKELLDAIIVNPNNKKEIVDAIKKALEMDENEKQERMSIMQNELRENNVIKWGDSFIKDLITITKNRPSSTIFLSGKEMTTINNSYCQSSRRLLLIDYDGTLVPFANHPDLATPNKEQKKILSKLTSDKANHIVIISGRSKNNLENWLGNFGVNLVAEHGVYMKEKGKWSQLRQFDSYWKRDIARIMQIFSNKLTGTFVEEKEYSVVWHYRAADSKKGQFFANELINYLSHYIGDLNIHILLGNKVVEVKSAEINKSIPVQHLLQKYDFDFILAIGDDVTDEDMFKVLDPKYYSIKVGKNQTIAKYHIEKQDDVIKLLDRISDLK